MKMSLKARLIISYVFISLFIITSLLVICRYSFDNSFKNYIKNAHRKNIDEVIEKITLEFESKTVPRLSEFQEIGENALKKGLIVTIKDKDNNIIWCMTCTGEKRCNEMLEKMKKDMSTFYPNISGEYTEECHSIKSEKGDYGTIVFGYYGPFYFTEGDMEFFVLLNDVFEVGSVIALLIAIFLGIFMANLISKPIKEVIKQTAKLEAGQYDEIMSESNTYEVDKLIGSINSLGNTLKEQLVMRKRLARDYAHELRTPLAALESNLEIMIDGIWEPTKERLESCNDEVLRITRMIEDINRLVRVEGENIKLNLSKFCIRSAILSVVKTFESKIKQKNISLSINGRGTSIVADEDKVKQIILNLVSNSVKYSKENGKINIYIKDDGNKITISILDNGIGIEEKHLKHIFEDLYRADVSRTTEGSGLGLSIVSALVKAHGGEVSVNSLIDVGSEFIVTLPKESFKRES